MTIICLALKVGAEITPEIPKSFVNIYPYSAAESDLPSRVSDEEALKMGDYREILNLTRVLVHGPKSKVDVDTVIEWCAGAGHLRDDILYYSKELEKHASSNCEDRTHLMDMGVKALRRYFFLITFRSYLYCTSPGETRFASWMDARPELGHLCNNLRIDK